MNSYILVPVVLYTAWAIYSGYKYVNGRYPWLEQPEIAHRICKYAAILGMGYIVGAGTIVKMGWLPIEYGSLCSISMVRMLYNEC